MRESKSDGQFHGWSTMHGNVSIRLCRSVPFSVVSRKAVAVLKTLRSLKLINVAIGPKISS